MDKLSQYRLIIKNMLAKDAKIKPANADIDPLLVFDLERDSYQLMYIGWNKHQRVHAPVVHVRLHNDKIWIEEDGTSEGVAKSLLEAGVPKGDIVLAFYPEWKRKRTEFAVN